MNFRRYPRSKANLGTLIELNFPTDNSQSTYLLKGLMIDNSLGGCGIIVVTKNLKLVQENQTCYLKIPEENELSLKVKIIWNKKLKNHLFRLGIDSNIDLDKSDKLRLL